ncbi:Ribosomal protein L15e, partial [mine drainage metagenome]
NGEWLRVRGIGRERFAGTLADYLTSIGYRVERTETVEPPLSLLTATLVKMSPSVPPAANRLAFRLLPTSGGAVASWEGPTEVPAEQRPRMDRLVREMETHLERSVFTESHATAKIVRPPNPHLPLAAGDRPPDPDRSGVGIFIIGTWVPRPAPMSTSAYRYMARAFQETLGDEGSERRHERLLTWRRENTVTRLEHPTRLDRARALGFRAKGGYLMVRVRVRRGGQRKRAIIAGRRPKHKGILRMTLAKSLQRIAEERAAKHYPNLEVLNSYWVGEDGKQKFFEIILVDPSHPEILADPQINWIAAPTRRAGPTAGSRARATPVAASAGRV